MINQSHPTPEQLTDYVHGELDPRVDAAVHAHLAGCPACTETHQAETSLSEMLRDHARATERDMPLGLAQQIAAAAVANQGAEAPWRRNLGLPFRPAFALSLAAAVALALYFGFASNGRPAHANTVAAAYYIEHHAALATNMPFAEAAFEDTDSGDAR